MKVCPTCQTPIERKTGKFCNSSCAATYNNTYLRQRYTTRKNKTIASSPLCKRCNQNHVPKHLKHCTECRQDIKNSLDNEQLGHASSYHDSSKYSKIRGRARVKVYRLFKQNKLKRKCACCSYTKHVEVCHIKSISSFPKHAHIKTVNSLSNLTILCPNCHWEFDHGDLKISETQTVLHLANLIEVNVRE